MFSSCSVQHCCYFNSGSVAHCIALFPILTNVFYYYIISWHSMSEGIVKSWGNFGNFLVSGVSVVCVYISKCVRPLMD